MTTHGTGRTGTITAHDPRTGDALDRVPVTPVERVDLLARAAAEAAGWAADQPPHVHAALLESIAEAIEAAGDDIVANADLETALGTTRLEGELARTTGQLRFLAAHVRTGQHLDVVLDAEHDLRRFRVPVGPVAVFAASNFPLAFSVAGGDTASALAGGNPVVVKAHPLHPGTSELVADAVREGVAASDAPAGAFGVVHGLEAGGQLVRHPAIRAVAFTGSLAGGRAVEALTRDRDVPIPVHAEMGSVNPVVVTPRALAARRETILDGYIASATLGAGQFCTKPGLLFVPADHAGPVRTGVRQRLADHDPVPLLGTGIREAWRHRTDDWQRLDGVEVVHAGASEGPFDGAPTVLATDVDAWLDHEELREECFGPTSVVVAYASADDLERALAAVPGSLTGSVHAGGADDAIAPRAHRALRSRVGRLVHDGWPTGVAVAHGMHHGGPYPASTDGRHTSVGSAAVDRFLRPVAHQGVPAHLLPAPLRDDNPWGVVQRRVS
jgi:NADP-dependent aldehyde dehydrogenase